METKKILIVEDEIDFAEMVQTRLEMEGYEVTIATDAYEGNKEVMNNEPALIILDLNMPVGGGFPLLKRLRELPGKSHIPVVILTGRVVDEEVIRKAETFDVAAIFTKPYDKDKFMKKIKSIVPI